MAMNTETKKNVDQLYASVNFVRQENLVKAIDRPILIIGLGGTGIDALVEVKHKINRTFRKPPVPGTKTFKEKPDNIEFLGVDTSKDSKDVNKEEISLQDSELCVLYFNEMSGLLKNREGLPYEQREFLHPGLSSSRGNGSGAGGKRQAARLMLMKNVAGIRSAIRQKVELLTKGKNNDLLVYILTGIGGGTGSGCFIDIAYLLRTVLEQDFSILPNQTMIMGHIYLPDVNVAKGIPEEPKHYCMTNGYAALKELDYLMGIDERGEYFEQTYAPDLKCRTQSPPFDYVHLISSIDVSGVRIENGYEYCMNVAAENIITFTSQSGEVSIHERGRKQKKAFSLREHYDNFHNISLYVQTNEIYGGACRYIIMGAAAVRMPTDTIMMYLASLIFNRMSRLYDAEPREEDVLKFASSVRMDMDSVIDRLRSNIPTALSGYEKAPLYSWGNVIRKEIVDIDEELKRGYQKRAEEWFDQQLENMPVAFAKLLEQHMSVVFQDPDKGPIYANRLLVNDGTITLLSLIRNYIRVLEKEIDEAPERIRELRAAANVALNEARQALLFRNDKKNAYIEAKIREYDAKVGMEMNRTLVLIYEAFARTLRQQNETIYDVVTEILEALRVIFDHNDKIIMDSREVASGGNRNYYWDVIRLPDIGESIGAYLDATISTERLTTDFTAELLKQIDSWIGQEANVAGFIRDFLSGKFSAMVNLSLEAFIKAGLLLIDKKAKTVDLATAQQIANVDLKTYLSTELLPELFRRAKPLFAGSGLGVTGSERITITVPSDPSCDTLFTVLDDWSDGKQVEIIRSSLKDRITVIVTTCAVPLYMYSRLQDYEGRYLDLRHTKEGIAAIAGRHLRQSDSEDWENFPSPIPQLYWKTNGYYRREIDDQNAENQRLFARALKYGIIYVNPGVPADQAKYFVKATEPFDPAKYGVAGKAGGTIATDPATIGKPLAELKELLRTGPEVRLNERKEPMIYKIVSSTDQAMAQAKFLQSFMLVNLVKKEILKYEEIESHIGKLEGMLQEHRATRQRYEEFIKVLYTHTVTVQAGTTKYVFDPGVDGVSPIELLDRREHSRYPEFALYNALDRHPNKRTIVEQATERDKELANDANRLLENLNEAIRSLGIRKNALELTAHELQDGAEILAFYNMTLDSLQSLKTVLIA